MLKKSLLGLLIASLLAMFVSCGRTAEPEYESADMLADKLYTEADLNRDGVYAEHLDSILTKRLKMPWYTGDRSIPTDRRSMRWK